MDAFSLGKLTLLCNAQLATYAKCSNKYAILSHICDNCNKTICRCETPDKVPGHPIGLSTRQVQLTTCQDGFQLSYENRSRNPANLPNLSPPAHCSPPPGEQHVTAMSQQGEESVSDWNNSSSPSIRNYPNSTVQSHLPAHDIDIN